ncbi:PLDc N-terminal domain-containing protein [Cryobacterium sp. PAMC25264]|uniref:PLDc N-terminal domain-containing protein n=1 Tax=Cryobacterium sp. PAMC25264 TaxID=2861288 RepID=UPI001C637B56|nr:PLDc N-terminal domain-containing protein [Cryobacterium sp. PAMC25264]QYF73644.1 PLDc N-terminal domain-containing protein [Cryobacterium sp. PAMC25264]
MTKTFIEIAGALTERENVLDGAGVDGAQLGALIGLTLLVLAALGAIVLVAAALVQVAQAVHLSEPARSRWVLAVVFAPVFGALAWFAVGNRLQMG